MSHGLSSKSLSLLFALTSKHNRQILHECTMQDKIDASKARSVDVTCNVAT